VIFIPVGSKSASANIILKGTTGNQPDETFSSYDLIRDPKTLTGGLAFAAGVDNCGYEGIKQFQEISRRMVSSTEEG